MPDSDPTHSNEPGTAYNLPALVPRSAPAAGEAAEGWLARALRTVFGWKASTIRADLKDVLEDGAGETGFSPTERTMLKNILGLRERRIVDVMVPRADIIAVQRDISLGELMKVFESAAHSRLVVYDDTLDDAGGMVHIRDLVAFMTERAAASAKANTRRKQPFPAGLDLKAVDLSMPLSTTKIVREILFAPPSMPVLDLLAKMQTTRIHLALVVDEYGGADGVVSIEDIVEQIVGEIADEHDEEDRAGRGAPARRLVPGRCPRQPGGHRLDRRQRIRRRRSREGGGHARRIRRDPDRPRAGAGRAGPRPRSVRDRNPRRRSASGEEAEDLSQPRSAERQ